jgi:hypothetical protein
VSSMSSSILLITPAMHTPELSCQESHAQTGNSAFLLPPDIFSNVIWMYGPTMGILPANDPMVAKKSPNKTKMPYSSTRNPVRGHLTSIKMMPAANAAVPFNFCRRAKNTNVFCSPMMRVRPMRKRIWMSLSVSRRPTTLCKIQGSGATDIAHS